MTSVACDSFRPIAWSRADTRPTIVQVQEHNAVGRDLCGWRPKGR